MPVQKPIVVVGSINMDLVLTVNRMPARGETLLGSDFRVYPGGKGANQAVAAARLASPVRLIGRLGDDAFGMQLKNHLLVEGVDLSGVSISPDVSTGVAVILVEEGTGENSIVISPGANAGLTPADLDANIELIRTAGLVLTQLEIPLHTVQHLVEICSREGVPLILDPAPARELSSALLRGVKWLTPNDVEATFLLRGYDKAWEPLAPANTAKALLNTGAAGVVLKMGSRGAYIATNDGESAAMPPFSVQTLDTTAAGDAFNGAFAVALLMGMGSVASARFASAAAAISVTRAGAQPSMASLAEVNELIFRQNTIEG